MGGLILIRDEDFPHRVVVACGGDAPAMWCVERFGARHTYLAYLVRLSEQRDGVWDRVGDDDFRFRHARDAFEFKMRWG